MREGYFVPRSCTWKLFFSLKSVFLERLNFYIRASRPLSQQVCLNIAGIFKQYIGARNRVVIGYRTGPPGYIGWRGNGFLGTDSWAPYSLKVGLWLLKPYWTCETMYSSFWSCSTEASCDSFCHKASPSFWGGRTFFIPHSERGRPTHKP